MYPLLTAIGDIVRAPEFRGHRPPAVALIAAGALVIGGRILLALQIPGASLNPRAIALELLCALAFLGFVYLSAALHRAPAVMLSLIYALLYTANLEMIAAMDTVVELQDVVFAADEVFLSGSAAGLQFGWFGLILTAAFVLFAVLAGRAHRRHRCSKRRLAIGSAALVALAAALYLAPSGVTWLDDGLVRTSLRSTVRRAALTAADRPLHSLAQGDAELPRHTPAGPGTPGAPDASDQPRAAAETRGDLDGELLIPQAEGERNVLLVIIEGIPGVYLEQVQAAAEVPYEVTMPRFSEIADLGLLATQSVAHARQTVRGLYSALTGDYPRLNLATPKIYPYMQADEADRPPGLAAAMRELGYRSVYLQAAELSYMSKDRFMPEVGFEEVLGKDTFEYSHVPFEWGPDDKAYFEQVAEFIDELNNDDEPWFLSLLTVGTHHPYGVTDKFAADYPSRKIAAVAYLDEALGEFLERLEAAGHLEDTAVFIVSDESHGVTGHLLGRYWGTTVVRTPELRRTPQSEKPILQEQPVGLRDLPITILDYLGAEEQALRFAGRSVLRTHDSPRELWFGPYIAKPGEESTDGEENANRETAGMRVYHVPEGGRFDMYLPSTGSPFAPEYTRRTKREDEHRELAERLRDSYWAATQIPGVEYALDATDEPRVDPRKQSWVLVEDLRETVGAEESLILSGAQYLEIPAETNAELHLNLSVAEAPNGDKKLIRPALQVLAEYEPLDIELPSMPELAAGESLEFTIAFEAEQKLERVWIDLRAHSLSDARTAEVIVHNLTLELSPASEHNSDEDEPQNPSAPVIEPVAHAGGRYAGTTYTNSLEALEAHAESYNLFEIDFDWTADRRLVGLHDWGVIFERLYGFRVDEPLAYQEFGRLESPLGVTPLDLDLLQEFLDRHPHAVIVTDIKSENLEALEKIAGRIENHQRRIIPQVYHPDEFGDVLELGYEHIIWTLYRYAPNRNTERVVSEALELREAYADALFAVAMPTVVVEDGTAAALGEHEIPSFAHTINSCEEYRRMRRLGADSIFSDDLAPGGCSEMLSVLSFNVRLASAPDGEDGWENRRELVFEVIEDHDPDLVGLQEPEPIQLRELEERFPDYTFLGRSSEGGAAVGDDTAEGKFNAVMVRSERFSVRQDGTFWFSPYPERPGSREPEAALPRVCSWAKLYDEHSDETIYLYNLHLDYASQAARERSTELLLERMLERPSDGVVLVTGDFNANALNPALQLLRSDPGQHARDPRPLRDTFAVVHRGEKAAHELGTFHDFTGEPKTTKIDFVLAPASIEVLDAGIDRRSRDGRYPSDHFPVYAELKLQHR